MVKIVRGSTLRVYNHETPLLDDLADLLCKHHVYIKKIVRVSHGAYLHGFASCGRRVRTRYAFGHFVRNSMPRTPDSVEIRYTELYNDSTGHFQNGSLAGVAHLL